VGLFHHSADDIDSFVSCFENFLDNAELQNES